ncbi:alpha/beta hydrolase [Enterovirga sp. CN4-39]|uniref:alpha/beta hydrolase n=1 Tax=Enterovirga sp. CN4-39 TaxID=3400910 RepID=UPI003BFEC86B
METAPPRGTAVRPGHLGGVPGEWLEPQNPVAHLLYLHGGAYVLGSPATHRLLAGSFCRHGFRVFVPDYRLAPEHGFPAALDDCEAAYRGLLAQEGIDPDALAVAGESAGGGLTLSLLVRLRDGGVPLPAAAALFSPWTDLAVTGRSVEANNRAEDLFFNDNLRPVAELYLAGADPMTPLASPLYADLSGLPPLLVHVGERELLLDDAARLVERAAAAGDEVAFERWPVVPHGWQLLQGIVPEAARSVAEAAAFLHARIRNRAAAPGRQSRRVPA